MMKTSKSQPNGRSDQVMGRWKRVRAAFTGAWRCRPGRSVDFISPSPRSSFKERDLKKTPKDDLLKDPLFIKPTQPTKAREDNHLAIEWRQDGPAKESMKEGGQSQRGKVDGKLHPTPQQSPDMLMSQTEDDLKLEERDAADSQATEGKLNGQLQPKEAMDPAPLPTGLTKTESLDLFELLNHTKVSAADELKPQNDALLKAESLEEFNTAKFDRPSLPGDQLYGIEHLESSAVGKAGLVIDILHSESYSLQDQEAEGEKVKVSEESESPISVLQGIPDLETPTAESEKEKTWKETESHQLSVKGIPELKPQQGPLGSDTSSQGFDLVNNQLHSFAGSKLEIEQLECPSKDVQTNSNQFSDMSKSEKHIGTPPAESLQQTQDERLLATHPEVVDSEKNEAYQSVHGKEEHLESSGNYHSMGTESSDLREEVNGLGGLGVGNKEIQGGGLGDPQLDGFPKSATMEEFLPGKGSPLHGMAAASIQGTGEDGSNLMQKDHPDYTELQPSSHQGEADANLQPSERPRGSGSFKLGFITVPHVLVVGAITVVSLLGKAASG